MDLSRKILNCPGPLFTLRTSKSPLSSSTPTKEMTGLTLLKRWGSKEDTSGRSDVLSTPITALGFAPLAVCGAISACRSPVSSSLCQVQPRVVHFYFPTQYVGSCLTPLLSALPRLLESCSNSPTVLEHAPLSAQICHPFPLLSPSCEILKHNALLR